MKISGSVSLSELVINRQRSPVEPHVEEKPSTPTANLETPPAGQEAPLEWAVSGRDLGRHSVGDQLTTTLSATHNGIKLSSYVLLSGTLPPSISLNTKTGVLSGLLTSPGYFVFTLRAHTPNLYGDSSYGLTVV